MFFSTRGPSWGVLERLRGAQLTLDTGGSKSGLAWISSPPGQSLSDPRVPGAWAMWQFASVNREL